jgi:hypothetical protein
MDERQITGDTVQIFIQKKDIHSFEAFPNAFVIGALNEGDSVYFDQVKGRKMKGFFTKNELTKLDVIGNGQLLYFPKENEDDKKSIGLNKGECSEITLTIQERRIKKINLKKKPDSYFIPIQKISDEKLKLEDFHWRISERPDRNSILK